MTLKCTDYRHAPMCSSNCQCYYWSICVSACLGYFWLGSCLSNLYVVYTTDTATGSFWVFRIQNHVSATQTALRYCPGKCMLQYGTGPVCSNHRFPCLDLPNNGFAEERGSLLLSQCFTQIPALNVKKLVFIE